MGPHEMLVLCFINQCTVLVFLHNFLYFSGAPGILCILCKLLSFRTKKRGKIDAILSGTSTKE